MEKRLASILYTISRHDPMTVEEFQNHFRALREEARDRFETGSTPEIREEARQESRAYSKIIRMFEDAHKIVIAEQAKKEGERFQGDNMRTGHIPPRGIY